MTSTNLLRTRRALEPFVRSAAFLAALTACAADHEPGPPATDAESLDGGTATRDGGRPDALPDGSECAGDPCEGGCCLGAICETTSQICVRLGLPGTACDSPFDCYQSTCVDSVCQVGECIAAFASDCTIHGSVCCADLYCEVDGDDRGRCVYARSDGSDCSPGSVPCASNHCIDGGCRTIECESRGAECTGNADCCEGVCEHDPSTGARRCGPRRPSGGRCDYDFECESNECMHPECV